MNKAIIVDHLSKNNLLSNISFTIQSGEFVGLISSEKQQSDLLFSLVSGVSNPTSGFISVLGFDPYLKSKEYLRQISYISNSKNLLTDNLSPIEILEITKNIYGLSDREFNKNLHELTQYINDPALIDSLIYKPKILLIDNPQFDIELLYKYNKDNESAVMIASKKIDTLIGHVRRVVILDGGSLIYDGSIDEVILKYAKEKIIKIKTLSEIDFKKLNEIGTVRKHIYPYVYVQAPRSVSSFTAAEIVQNFSVESITIEELSVNELIENIKNE